MAKTFMIDGGALTQCGSNPVLCFTVSLVLRLSYSMGLFIGLHNFSKRLCRCCGMELLKRSGSKISGGNPCRRMPRCQRNNNTYGVPLVVPVIHLKYQTIQGCKGSGVNADFVYFGCGLRLLQLIPDRTSVPEALDT